MTKRLATITLTIILSIISAAEAAEIEFSRDIRPILSDTCFQCHGPDSKTREADLRLDTKEGAFADLDGHRAIEPGELHKSELYRRITSNDPDERMPPPDSKRKLTERQIALIKEWIEQGASWEQHWSFVPPRRPLPPKVSRGDWCRNPIDTFILARLDRERLAPSSTANKATLIRRVSLDLTGLPPTQAEIDAFLADDSDEAYERVVDRLLRSPRYGERMATRWLDAARYADTSGYQNDGPRSMWRWRDWVIDAYNSNMRFDQFTIKQLAGDLFHPPLAKLDSRGFTTGLRGEEVIRDATTLDDLIASAFNRNHRGNAEGGIIPEEYQVEYVVDRVDTTATLWLGLTMGCGRCHDHKYDPISQKDFYRFFAYFNNVPEYGRAIKEGNSPPFIKAPTEGQLETLRQMDNNVASAAKEFAEHDKVNALNEWENTFRSEQPVDWTPSAGLVAYFPLDGDYRSAIGNSVQAKERGGRPEFVDGRVRQAAKFDGKGYVELGDVAKFDYFDSFTIAAWVFPSGDGSVVSRMNLEPEGAGFALNLKNGRVQFNMVKRWLDDSIRVESTKQLSDGKWNHIAVTYDGTRIARGVKIYVNGNDTGELTVNHDFLNQTFSSDEPFRVGAGHANFHGSIDDVRIYGRVLSPAEIQMVSVAETITEILAMPPEKRGEHQMQKLIAYFLEHQSPKPLRGAFTRLFNSIKQRAEFEKSLPTLMVMQELVKPRQTFVLQRGEYSKPGEKVSPGVPTVFPPLPTGAPNNRLGLARWLVDPANPLTARVAVNRYWQMYFGRGLVATVEDFGSQGARPSHPQLLDWLAVEFMDSGWNVKHMQKLIVMSNTYRQASRLTDELQRRDPTNELLARGSRLRLPAETIRDQALAASGLLYEKVGGPSVKPYQPTGLWNEIASDKNYQQSSGPDLYRRSVYTYWKRTVAPPTMSTFDASNRESCVVRQTRTNTPLQALALMNDVTYIEAARALAERMILEGGTNMKERIVWGFRQVTCRTPTDRELQILARQVERSMKRYQTDPKAAAALLEVGDFRSDASIDQPTLAAYSTLASLILNLDEVVTKQ